MKITIITVSFNSAKTIEDCILSVLNQSYKNIEYIVIDGGSTDGTVDIIKKYDEKIKFWISEEDNGIYDAMNKGIRAGTGEIVGIINSDDMYADSSVIKDVARAISDGNVHSCYGDMVLVHRENVNRIIRYWKSREFSKERFKKGWMPPHPTFFVKKDIYDRYGGFHLNLSLAADYELMLRFLYKHDISCVYIPRVLIKMRSGGSCRPTLSNTIYNSISCYKAWKMNGLKPKPMTFFFKPMSKIIQFLKF